jgi:hypothetical protein
MLINTPTAMPMPAPSRKLSRVRPMATPMIVAITISVVCEIGCGGGADMTTPERGGENGPSL